MRPIYVSAAGPEDDGEIRELLRTRAMDGAIRLCLAREPSALAAARIEGDRHTTVVVRDEPAGPLVGIGNRSVRRVYHDGNVARLGYLGGLRGAPGRHGLRRLRAGFEHLEKARRHDELPFDVTSIVADNAVARRLLERTLPGLPRYEHLANFTTFVITTRAGPPRAGNREQADATDLAAVADCLKRNYARYEFAPIWEVEDLRSDVTCPALHPHDLVVRRSPTGVSACAAIWDQRAFKQVVVDGYAPWLARLRPIANLAMRVGRRPRLPRPGSQLSLAYLSHVAVDGDDVKTFLDLLREARTRAARRGIDYLVTGFAEGHPFEAALCRSVPARTYKSVLYRTHPPGNNAPSPAPPQRIVHFEAATL